MGAGVTQGTLDLSDVSISDLDNGIVVTEDAEVTLNQFLIERCRDTGIILQSGRLTYLGGKIQDCGVGAMLGDETRWPEITASASLEAVQISRCASYAIAAYSGPVRLTDLDISECMYGIYVHGPPKEASAKNNPAGANSETEPGAGKRNSQDSPAVEVSAENIRFSKLQKVAVLARGDCRVKHHGLEIDPKSSFEAAVAVGGAEISAANP